MTTVHTEKNAKCAYCRVLRAISIAGGACFGLWMLANITLFDGLSAINGQNGSENGIYLIGGNGRFMEVSKLQYARMLASEFFAIFCFLTAFVCGGIRIFSPSCRAE
ncbi:hypothetical protein [uncultured Tateyamaria sp.]|nr:hypothetical protein [uncultured Tateyamaria sp.]